MLHIARLEIDWSRRRRRSRRRGVREIGALRALRNAEMGAIIAPSLSTSVSDSLPSARPSQDRNRQFTVEVRIRFAEMSALL